MIVRPLVRFQETLLHSQKCFLLFEDDVTPVESGFKAENGAVTTDVSDSAQKSDASPSREKSSRESNLMLLSVIEPEQRFREVPPPFEHPPDKHDTQL